jgi:iron-sulfur cluster assembly accessory protein
MTFACAALVLPRTLNQRTLPGLLPSRECPRAIKHPSATAAASLRLPPRPFRPSSKSPLEIREMRGLTRQLPFASPRSHLQRACPRRALPSMCLSTAAAPAQIVLTDRAMERISALRKNGNAKDLLLRLSVEGGGCSGFSYKFSTATEPPDAAEDVVFNHMLVVDTTSLAFCQGSKVDFTEDLIRRSFEVLDNPQVETKCGCGTSFSPKPSVGAV